METQGRSSSPVVDELLEREQELDLLDTTLQKACAGGGTLVLVRGGAGAGKTALLQAAQVQAETRGMHVASARGAEREREFPFGVVRQLLEPTVARMTREERARLFAGSASLARPLFSGRRQASSAGDPLALVEGLAWLIANLSRHVAPLLLCVDDAHWCDRTSLRALARTALHLNELPVVIVLALRPAAPGPHDDLVAWLAADPGAVVLEPAALSEQAVHQLVESTFDEPGEAAFSAACWSATGGNPFLVRALVDGLHADGIRPTGHAVELASTMVPDLVVRSVLARISSVGHDARALADAVAVLGAGASLHDAAALAELAPEAADRAADALARVGVLSAGPTLSFRHPLLAGAVEGQLPAHARARAHGRAAQLLAARGAGVERVAGHLLESPPTGDPSTVSALRSAAFAAVSSGDPPGAVRLLRRALDEPPPVKLRGEVVLELARAEAAAGDVGAVEHLLEALELLDDHHQRVRALRELSRLQFLSEHHREAASTAARALAEAHEDDPVAKELLVEYLAAASLDSTTRGETEERFAALIAESSEGRPPTDPGLLIQVANALSVGRAPRPRVAELLERVLAGGPLDDLPPYGLAASWAVSALACTGDLELARRVAAQAHATARRRGSVYDMGKATFSLAVVEYLLGQLDQAVHQAMVAVELGRSGVTSILAWGSAVLCLAHLEQGDLVAADKAVRIGECTDPTRVSYGMVLDARARLDLAEGRPAAALAHAFAARDALARHHLVNYPLAAWRLPAAVAAAALGRLDEARGLADEEVALSRASLSPPQLGAALTVRGRIECGERQLPFLREAVDALEGAPARLLQAAAYYHLGAAHRLHGDPVAARTPLLRALELAGASGAVVVAASARHELHLIGVRPRRTAHHGLAALTSSERQVAELAAADATNQEIADRLYITKSTVEFHLTRAYRKLGLASRRELAPLFEPPNDS